MLHIIMCIWNWKGSMGMIRRIYCTFTRCALELVLIYLTHNSNLCSIKCLVYQIGRQTFLYVSHCTLVVTILPKLRCVWVDICLLHRLLLLSKGTWANSFPGGVTYFCFLIVCFSIWFWIIIFRSITQFGICFAGTLCSPPTGRNHSMCGSH